MSLSHAWSSLHLTGSFLAALRLSLRPILLKPLPRTSISDAPEAFAIVDCQLRFMYVIGNIGLPVRR